MRKLAVGALLAGALVACGGSNSKKTIVPLPDGSTDSGSGAACNVLTQTGCMTGQKCTWVEDNNASPPLGHIGCVADGTVAVGGACTYGPPGMTGFDNCTKGNICLDSQCKQICDQTGGSPKCATGFACGLYDGVFGPAPNGPFAAGACDPTCDPFADNTFGSSTKPGSGCGSQQGCYGFPDSAVPAHYTCGAQITTTGNEGTCTGNCLHLNGCVQGAIPLLNDNNVGSQTVICVTYCSPADCSTANCGGATDPNLQGNPNAVSAADPRKHRCNPADIFQGTVAPSTGTGTVAGQNKSQCVYEWRFDVDPNTGNLQKSPTMDTMGFCYDHSQNFFPKDPTSMVACMSTSDPNCMPAPECNTLAAAGSGSAYFGVDFGCVSTTTGGVMLGNKPKLNVEFPRKPYHATFAHN